MKYLALLTSLALAGLPMAALAADAAPASSLTVGAGIGAGPNYAGSKETQASFAPMLDYRHESGFFASTQRGIGWGLDNDGLKFSMALGARGERSDKPRRLLGPGGGSKELRGMGTVKASALAMIGAGVQLGERLELNAALELPLTQRENGSALHAGAGLMLLQGKQDSLTLNGTLSYADGKYMRSYFGVTPAQSLTSGYAAYTPKAGLYKADLNLAWTHRIDERWGVIGMAGVSHLLGDAGKSPLARRKTAPEGGLMVTYSY